jgi:uncharacterized protein
MLLVETRMDLTSPEFAHWPEKRPDASLILTHGAGGNCRAPLLVAVADAFRAAGVFVFRYDLPFRQRRPFGPPAPATAAADRAGLREAVDSVRTLVPGPVFLCGHSYGGRQATLLASEDPELTGRLLLLSYPLHPPKKPEQMRTAHFPSLRTPAMFVHGTRDDFGSVEEMLTAQLLIPARTSLVSIEGAGQDLNRGKFDLERLVVQPFLSAE